MRQEGKWFMNFLSVIVRMVSEDPVTKVDNCVKRR